MENRACARAVDLEGPKFGIKHKNCCLQKKKLVEGGSQACQLGGGGKPFSPLGARPDVNETEMVK